MKKLLFISLLLAGCASQLTRPQMDEKTNYQRDITFGVQAWLPQQKAWSKEFVFNGTGVMGVYPKYKITVYPPGKADMVTLTGCHREMKTPPAPKEGWFQKVRPYSFEFEPNEVDLKTGCAIDMGIYEKKAGRHGWALLAFDNGITNTLVPELVLCNGEKDTFYGVSICQAKAGLIQEYKFKVPVAIAAREGCVIDQSKDELTWMFRMPASECTVYFIDKKQPDITHKAHFFGYDTTPIRGVE